MDEQSPNTEEKKEKPNEEEAGMQCFVDYIRGQGLVIVEASQLANQTPKFNKVKDKSMTMGMQSVVNRRPANQGEDDCSVAMVYRNAVKIVDSNNNGTGNEIANRKRESSSSDEPLDTSDELDKLAVGGISIQTEKNINVEQFISDVREQSEFNKGRCIDEPRCGMERQNTPEQATEKILKEVERYKARVYDVQGKIDWEKTYHSALLDEDYLLVGNYVDDITRNNIAKGEYVDFVKLMPRDKIGTEDEYQCMEMVNKGGLSYWMPVTDRDNTAITSYSRWEQAFRMFSNLYTVLSSKK